MFESHSHLLGRKVKFMDFFYFFFYKPIELETTCCWDIKKFCHILTDMLKMSHMLIYGLERLCVFMCVHQEDSALLKCLSQSTHLYCDLFFYTESIRHGSKYAFTFLFF